MQNTMCQLGINVPKSLNSLVKLASTKTTLTEVQLVQVLINPQNTSFEDAELLNKIKLQSVNTSLVNN